MVSISSLKRLAIKNAISIKNYLALNKILKKKAIRKKCSYLRKKRFNLSYFNDDECLIFFRFSKFELSRLLKVLRIPNICRLHDKTKFTGIEGICLLLRRLSYPTRYYDLQKIFNRDQGTLSKMCKWMTLHIYKNFRFKLATIIQSWMSKKTFYDFSQKCINAGSYYKNIIGFIDGTTRPICRPSKNQKLQYSGYKKEHVLKYQSIVLPNGLIGRLDGPFNGHRHDAAILKLSKIHNEFNKEEFFFNNKNSNFYLFGDVGYSNQKFIKESYKNYKKLTPRQKLFNSDMSGLRVSVEYGFGKILQQFAFLDFKKNQKLLLQNLKEQYFVAALLVNAQTCLRGNQISNYFNCSPPTLEEYFSI